MQKIAKICVGVDISKNTLDVHLYPLKKTFKLNNDEDGIRTLITKLKLYDVECIGCEATGGYEQFLARILKEHSYTLWIIDPRRIKGFITARGCKSKTDKIDAYKIAEFIAQHAPDYTPFVKTETQSFLQALINRKNDLVAFLATEKTRLKHPSHAASQDSIKKFIEILNNEIKNLEKQIEGLIKQDKELDKKAEILESIPGIGKATAAILLSFVPELGSLSNSKIASLVGLCPYENESGKFRGKKRIRGGRVIPRKQLYMCALTTIKHNLILKSFYDRLIAAQKPFKIAIVAVMRKLIILANSLLKKGELCAV